LRPPFDFCDRPQQDLLFRIAARVAHECLHVVGAEQQAPFLRRRHFFDFRVEPPVQ
jgi:hypothetical protein